MYTSDTARVYEGYCSRVEVFQVACEPARTTLVAINPRSISFHLMIHLAAI